MRLKLTKIIKAALTAGLILGLTGASAWADHNDNNQVTCTKDLAGTYQLKGHGEIKGGLLYFESGMLTLSGSGRVGDLSGEVTVDTGGKTCTYSIKPGQGWVWLGNGATSCDSVGEFDGGFCYLESPYAKISSTQGCEPANTEVDGYFVVNGDELHFIRNNLPAGYSGEGDIVPVQ